jgi:hypothetical protein
MERFIRKNMENLDIFLEFFEELNTFSILAQNIGIAFIAILIPIAMAIFRDKDFGVLDTYVILDWVVNSKKLFASLGMILFIPFIWYITNNVFINSIGLLLWLFGIYIILKILGNCYKWIKGHKMNLRFNYLETLKNIQDMEESWHSVWQTKNVNIQNEREFFKIFSITIDQLSKSTKKNLKTISKLLNDFYNSINNRSIAFLVIPEDVFPKILDWHFKIWQKKYKLSGKESKLDKRSNYNEILRILNDIFNKIEERSFKERMAYSFFEHFEKHTEHYKKKLVENNKKRYYIDSLFSIFCRVFFENVAKSPEKHDIWEHYFPEGWKIKKSNYEKNIITRELCSKFLQWARDIVLSDKKELARDLGNISSNLFPEVEPSLWITILLLFVYSRYKDNRMKMKSLIEIEHFWDFGPIWRVRIRDFSSSNGEAIRKMDEAMQLAEEAEMKNTFELACLLFREQFSKENLEKYIKSLKELEPEYKEEPEKEKKRLYLLYAFNKMLKFLIKQNDNII